MLLPNKNTLFVGKVVLHFPILDSTNKYALELLAKSRPTEGTVISTSEQVAGRGQIGRSWVSEPHQNIAASIIFYPSFLAVRQQFLLSQAVALGVAECLEKYLDKKEVKVKWPNDIYAGSGKLAGILIQNSLSGTRIVSSVVGIGINVNQTGFPSELPNPSSLFLETGNTFDLPSLLDDLCYHLETRYLQLRGGSLSELRSDYHARLYRLEENICFQPREGRPFQGSICGVDEQGQLLVRKTDDSVEAFDLQAVRYR